MRNSLIAASLVTPAIALSAALPATAAPAKSGPVVHAAASGHVVTTPVKGLTCAGSVLARSNALYKGKVFGTLTVYLTPGRNGTVIACMSHAGHTRNHIALTAVVIGAADTRSATRPRVTASRTVRTSTVAGPVGISNLKVIGHKFTARGAIVYGGRNIATAPVSYYWGYVKR